MKSIATKILELLAYARENVVYWAGLLPSLDAHNTENIEEFIQTLPLLSRQDIQDQGPRLICTNPKTKPVRKTRSSGTTGAPIEIFWDVRTIESDSRIFANYIDQIEGSQDWRNGRVVNLVLHKGAKSGRIPASWSTQGEIIKWNLIRLWNSDEIEFNRSISFLNDCIVTALPSTLELLCSRTYDKRITPRRIILSGEMVEPSLRKKARHVFHCPVYSIYTMAEAGIIAVENEDEGLFNVSSDSVYLEIVDHRGICQPSEYEGEVVITTLNNYVMPLIRYRTGDKAIWIDDTRSQFKLIGGRRSEHIISEKGHSFNTIRFAKAFSSLNIKKYRLLQTSTKSIVFFYFCDTGKLDQETDNVLRSILMESCGPSFEITIQQTKSLREFDSFSFDHLSEIQYRNGFAEGIDLHSDTIVSWLRSELKGNDIIQVAVLFGSIGEPCYRSQYSDIDMHIFVANEEEIELCFPLIKKLSDTIKPLSINIDVFNEFEKRTPLIACRLLSEQISVINTITQDLLPWPSLKDIQSQGVSWLQDIQAALFSRIYYNGEKTGDPVRDLYVASKWAINALRYRYLAQGDLNTKVSHITSRVMNDSGTKELWDRFIYPAFQIGREIHPPPSHRSQEINELLRGIYSAIRTIQFDLIHKYQTL